jgi:hypothetical protein
MIYCVWYPSGGFGHFINAILTLRGQGFVRPKKNLEFSSNGNSHNLDLVIPKYAKDCWPGGIEFLNDKNYCVLIDNGIDHESDKFKSTFPNSKIIKICYTDYTWPVVARTMIEKAMNSSIEEQLPVNNWSTDAPWAQREKYFLFLRDHNFRHAWRSVDENDIDIDDLYDDYEVFVNILNSITKIEWCEDLWNEWRIANAKYTDPVVTARKIIDYVSVGWSYDLSDTTDIWTQSVVYYYIWLRFGIEVPHNDFANFFSNTEEIIKLIK